MRFRALSVRICGIPEGVNLLLVKSVESVVNKGL